MTSCAGCGFGYDALEVTAIPGTLLSFGDRYRAEIGAADEVALRRRQEPAVWSALEYACHVRDMFLVQRDRVIRTLVEECPTFARMHRDERVAMAADLLAWLFGGLTTEQLGRTCLYNYPETTERDLAWVGRHTVHEGNTTYSTSDPRSGDDQGRIKLPGRPGCLLIGELPTV